MVQFSFFFFRYIDTAKPRTNSVRPPFFWLTFAGNALIFSVNVIKIPWRNFGCGLSYYFKSRTSNSRSNNNGRACSCASIPFQLVYVYSHNSARICICFTFSPNYYSTFFLCFMHGFCFAMPVNHLMSPFYFSFAPSTFCLFIQLLLFYFILFFFGFFPLNTNTMLEYTFILDIEYNFPKTNGIGTGLRETNSKKFVFGEYSRGK